MKYEKFYNRIKDLSKDNRGSTIVMVLVAFLFVSVLVAMILSTVVVNFRMRAIDRKTKDEFYYAEKALNDVYAGLGENCAKALGNAYNITMSSYVADDYGTYQNQIQAYDTFCIEYLKAIYASTDPTTGGTYGLSLKPGDVDKDELIAKMNSYIVGKRAKVTNVGDIYYYSSDKNTTVTQDEDKRMYPNIKYTVIKNVKVLSNMTSSDNTGYMSGVTADIVIETPQIDFFTVNEEDVEYALAASDGIEFNGNADIKGSVYGGSRVIPEINNSTKIAETSKLMTDASDYGGILVNGSTVTISGKYVVSGGDLYIKKNGSNSGSLTINNNTKNEIWFDNLTLDGDESSANLKGDLYAMGDLQVEGEGAKVVIEGNYYGYNDGNHESKTDYLLAEVDRSKANESSKFSSIIVNAKKADIDMTNLDTLVLLGKAYINYNSKRTDDSNSLQPLDGSTNLVSDIGESVALKSGQDIFLCPSEFLKGSTNPAEIENEGFDFKIDTNALQNWFGYRYLSTTGRPTRTVKLQKNGVNRAYCYLNFKGDTPEEVSKNQQAYIDRIVNSRINSDTAGCEPTPQTILERLERANRLQDSEIRIGNDDTRIYANGSIVQYERKEKSAEEINRDVPSLGTVSVKGNTADFKRYASYSNNMHYKYQRLCTYLDPMTNSSISVNNGTDVSADDYASKNLPFGRLFWLNGIQDASTKNYNGSESTVIVCSAGSDSDIFYDGRGSAVDIVQKLIDNGITPNGSENVFMIIDGDAYVKDSVNINGFIYVNGELIVDKDATLTVNYSSTLLDRRIEAELKKLKEDYAARPNKDAKPETVYQKGTLIYYLLNYPLPEGSSKLSPDVEGVNDSNIGRYRKYVISPETGDIAIDVTSDYTQFMYFENWRKGL